VTLETKKPDNKPITIITLIAEIKNQTAIPTEAHAKIKKTNRTNTKTTLIVIKRANLPSVLVVFMLVVTPYNLKYNEL